MTSKQNAKPRKFIIVDKAGVELDEKSNKDTDDEINNQNGFIVDDGVEY